MKNHWYEFTISGYEGFLNTLKKCRVHYDILEYEEDENLDKVKVLIKFL